MCLHCTRRCKTGCCCVTLLAVLEFSPSLASALELQANYGRCTHLTNHTSKGVVFSRVPGRGIYLVMLSLSPSVCLSVSLSVCLSVRLCLPACLSLCLSLSLFLSVCLSVRLSLSLSLSVCLSVSACLSVSVCLSLSLSFSLSPLKHTHTLARAL